MFLRQPPDERVGRGDADRTVERLEIPGKDPQKCALAGAVGAYDSDYVARCHGHVKSLKRVRWANPPATFFATSVAVMGPPSHHRAATRLACRCVARQLTRVPA